MRQSLNRLMTELGRRLRRKQHEIVYFHRADDPYCQLMVQILPEFAERFNVKVLPRVVERLPANMYPDPARYEAYSIIDSGNLAHLYGIGFPDQATVPDRLAVGMVNRYLAANQDHPDFFEIAEELGSALWQQDVTTIRNACAIADMEDSRLSENEKLLSKLGHYASGLLYYGGEFYPGLDRLDHLENRLNGLGLGDGEIHYELTRIWQFELGALHRAVAGRTVDLYFSPRSPYSYLGLSQLMKFCDETGVRIRLKPVMPMVLRGMKVPVQKLMYILEDVAREARQIGVPFGKMVDPLGPAIEHAMAYGMKAIDEGVGEQFFMTFYTSMMAEGADLSDVTKLKSVMAKAGIPDSVLANPLSKEEWELRTTSNRKDLLLAGGWGVPTMCVDGHTMWGQDRIWAVADALKKRHQ